MKYDVPDLHCFGEEQTAIEQTLEYMVRGIYHIANEIAALNETAQAIEGQIEERGGV